MNCPSCGAIVEPAEVRCAQCGRTISQLGVASAGQEPLSPELSPHAAELEELLRHTPSAAPKLVQFVLTIVLGVAFTGFAIFFIVSSRRSGAPVIFQVFPVIFVLVGMAMVAGGLRVLVRLTTSPLLRLPGVVLGKREERSRASESSSTTYYLTIKSDDGREKEYPVSGRLFSKHERGDVGVAYLKGGCLLDFKSLQLREN